MNLLHSADTLVHIAETSGPAADWARVLLAFAAPERMVGLPMEHAAITPWLIVRPATVEDLVPALADHRESAAVALLEALELGLCPEEPKALSEALMAQLAGHDDVADLHIAAALGRMGLVDARALAAAAQSPCVDRDWLLPPLVMRVSERVGKTEAAAAEVAEGLLTAERTRPGAIALCLAELGIPSRSSWESPEHLSLIHI